LRAAQSATQIKHADEPNAIVRAYFSLLNSETFSRLLKVYSDPVQGGQFNLSARFVRPIPLPNLRSIENTDLAIQLTSLSRTPDLLSPTWLRKVETIASMLWGGELVSALAELDDV
jgi:hypothetical protein